MRTQRKIVYQIDQDSLSANDLEMGSDIELEDVRSIEGSLTIAKDGAVYPSLSQGATHRSYGKESNLKLQEEINNL